MSIPEPESTPLCIASLKGLKTLVSCLLVIVPPRVREGLPPNAIEELGAVEPVVLALVAFVDLRMRLCDGAKGLLGETRASREDLTVLIPMIPAPAEMMESFNATLREVNSSP